MSGIFLLQGRTPFWSAGYVVWLAFRRIGGYGFVNEKAKVKVQKIPKYFLTHLIASIFDFYLQRINDTLEIPNGQIWAREEAREASPQQRHSRRYRTVCFRYLCELVRSRRIDLLGLGKGICCRRWKRAIQSLWGHRKGNKTLETENETFP